MIYKSTIYCYTQSMLNLSAAGLNVVEAKCYRALLSKKEWKPAELAEFVQETRTNCYKILDNLVELGLAKRYDKNKKFHYSATNPTVLLQLASALREQRQQAEKELEAQTNALLIDYLRVQEQPGVRYLQGPDEIGTIYTEVASAKTKVSFIHTPAGIDYYGFKQLHNYRMLAATAGVKRVALTPDSKSATIDYKTTDSSVNLERTWLKKDDYTAPVEWGTYDDKLYIISYGKEAMGMIIQSPQIADSFSQLFRLLQRGQKLLPDYTQLPKHASKSGVYQPILE